MEVELEVELAPQPVNRPRSPIRAIQLSALQSFARRLHMPGSRKTPNAIALTGRTWYGARFRRGRATDLMPVLTNECLLPFLTDEVELQALSDV